MNRFLFSPTPALNANVIIADYISNFEDIIRKSDTSHDTFIVTMPYRLMEIPFKMFARDFERAPSSIRRDKMLLHLIDSLALSLSLHAVSVAVHWPG